jgi:hypothetical protein
MVAENPFSLGSAPARPVGLASVGTAVWPVSELTLHVRHPRPGAIGHQLVEISLASDATVSAAAAVLRERLGLDANRPITFLCGGVLFWSGRSRVIVALGEVG